jgi:hypothetical protein
MAKIGNQGDGGGRPLVVFDAAQTAQVEALAAVLSKGQMADYFSISETTLREVESRQPEVFDAYKRAKPKLSVMWPRTLSAKRKTAISRRLSFT